MSPQQLTLALLSCALLLACAVGSLIVSWRAMHQAQAWEAKAAWLRREVAERDARIRSYENTAAPEFRRTTILPPPLPPRKR